MQHAPHLVPDDIAVHGRGDALVDEAVDEREDFSARISLRRQQPEMVGVMREPSADALRRRPLGGQIRRRLNGAERLPVIFRCMSDVHEISLLKAVPSKGGWEAPFCNAQNPYQQYRW